MKTEINLFGGRVSCLFKKTMNSVKLCLLAESFGLVDTQIIHPATITYVDIPREQKIARWFSDGLVRLSVRLENPEEFIFDLELALKGA
ncbi:MAG: PLP-dependent transferase [Candidatus Marinimicrobia bacterium]|jgi:cystathionine beta-lyase/cystathionine gamma-synthase|nr:PLP-dependent transferase [Candidatus Neomarinimicrobiota bacterium]MBT3501227.1 PLP-dependent transferase [Candidatus Neomarinimicrobiota bacterium]MBT3839508.1 PLP-dependent transferase [Candidatus Neomarinimicrobiota bacterium]MBT3999409.1 PLP-dependent transferase [Candidatus Neomarinimicrobiota bacterium]MBT4282507.1 PLP-dependent transferase [Candidatus Neomarinimicrobiota bacterium]